jgi:hypothetical protein
LFLPAILKIYAVAASELYTVSGSVVAAGLIVRPNFVISACDTLMKDTAYIFKMADKNKTLAASDRNCGDHSLESLVNKYSSYDILRHYILMLKTAASAFNCFEPAI